MKTSTLLAVLLVLACIVVAAWLLLARMRQRPARGRGPAVTRPAPLSARAQPAADASERVKRDIEDRVQSLRRAREQAERWVPPPVDAVPPRPRAAEPPAFADTSFADTTIPDDDDPPPLPKPRA